MKIIIWIIFWAASTFLNASSTEFRLDRKIVPEIYHIDLFVDPKLDYFLGNVFIKLKVEKPQSNVSLHYDYTFIEIHSVYLNNDVECHEKNYDTTTEIAQFECSQQLTKYDALNINFRGQFETNSKLGFYKSTYIRNGEKNTILNTFFAPGYTRRAFPCFDEPSLKAKFKLTITYPKKYVAITNTLERSTDCISNNFNMAYFFVTPKMSTHAVSIYITHPQPLNQSDTEMDGYSFNIYNELCSAPYLKTIQDYSRKFIMKMDLWTSISYRDMYYMQLYLIVLPELVLASKANWGLIYFREEDFILNDDFITTAPNLDGVLIMLAHEIAHQWFGNYVTAYWWSDIWLSEGLATYFGFHTFSESLLSKGDEFEMYNKFVGDCLNDRAFSADDQPTSFPLSRPENEINTKEEAISCYGDISSAKGASIIRMICYLIGARKFRTGMALFLRKWKYEAVDSQILLNELEKVAEQDEVDFPTKMKSWIYEAGFPLVIATLEENSVVLRQKPFNKNATTQWWIPISYTTSSKKNFTFKCSTWLKPNQEIKISLEMESWIIFNLQVVGFYRVMYDRNLLYRIMHALKGDDIHNIHTLNKAQLIYDTFKLAELGKIPYVHAFNLAEYLSNETEYYPWRAACTVFSDLFDKINHETKNLLKERIAEYMEEAISSTKFSNEPGNKHINRLKNNLLQEWECILGKEVCINYAKKELKKFKSSKPLSDYDKRDLVFCYGLKHSNNSNKDYKFLLKLFKKTQSFALKMSILKSLGCISQEKTLNKCMLELISMNIISEEKYAKVILDSLIANDQTEFQFTLKFFTEQSNIIKTMTESSSVFENAIYTLARKMFCEDQMTLFSNLLNSVELPEKSVLKLNMILANNYDWRIKYGSQITYILKKEWSLVDTHY